MNLKQIECAKNALNAIGVDLSNYTTDIGVNLFDTAMLTFRHNTKNISIVVEDPTNYPNTFRVDMG